MLVAPPWFRNEARGLRPIAACRRSSLSYLSEVPILSPASAFSAAQTRRDARWRLKELGPAQTERLHQEKDLQIEPRAGVHH
jgi:hypothetical protein